MVRHHDYINGFVELKSSLSRNTVVLIACERRIQSTGASLAAPDMNRSNVDRARPERERQSKPR